MKINPITNNNSFKGYDALPLKAVHIQDRVADSFFWELEEIGKKEGFEVRYSPRPTLSAGCRGRHSLQSNQKPPSRRGRGTIGTMVEGAKSIQCDLSLQFQYPLHILRNIGFKMHHLACYRMGKGERL